MPLNDVIIRNALPKEKKYKLTDKDGLYLLVNPSGGKYFKYDYRFNGIKKEYSIGVYPKISLKCAREKLTEVKRLLASGINPNESKKLSKFIRTGGNTLKNIAAQWFDKNKVQWKPSHADRKWSRLEKNILTYLGDKPIKSITAPELLAVIRIMEARGVMDTAHRVKNIVSEIFSYAIASGLADRNIALDLTGALAAKPPVEHRPAITDPNKVGALMRAIEEFSGSFIVKAALKLSPYVMLRPIEIASAEWEHIDIAGKIWKIPADKMKMRRVHIVPLSRQVLEILEELKPQGGKFVFQSLRTKSRYLNPSSINAALRRIGYEKDEICAHGFRGMASTLLYENGFTQDIVELQLAHVEKNEVRAAYNHAQHLKRRAEMMQWWADYLDKLKGAEAPLANGYSTIHS